MPLSVQSGQVRFAVLGGVRGWFGGAELDLGVRRSRLMTALLVARAGDVVALPDLLGLLWEDSPPPTAVNMIHRYVGAIRRAFEPGLARRAEGEWLIRWPDGYRLAIDENSSDLSRFRTLVEHARGLLDAGESLAAQAAYVRALALWRGSFAAGMVMESDPRVAAVNRERATVVCEAAGLISGRRAATVLLPALRAAAAAEPLDELVYAGLLRTLTEAGRPAEAIEIYRQFRCRLDDALGMAPGPELTEAFENAVRPPAPAAPAPSSVPGQLPPGTRDFTGPVYEQAAEAGPGGRFRASAAFGRPAATQLKQHSGHHAGPCAPPGAGSRRHRRS